MSKKSTSKAPSAPAVDRAASCSVSELIDALKLHGKHAHRIVNALDTNGARRHDVTGTPFTNYLPNPDEPWCYFDCRVKKHGSIIVNLDAVKEAIADKTINRLRNFGKQCLVQLCSALNVPLDSRPRCPHCGQVWYSQNASDQATASEKLP